MLPTFPLLAAMGPKLKLLGAVGLVASIALGFYQIWGAAYRAGQSAEKASCLANANLALHHYADEIMAARARENALQTQADQLLMERQNAEADLNHRIIDLVGQLRDRPQRPTAAQPAGMPQTAQPEPTPCTGDRLYRDDAEFLTRLAATADQMSLALQQCRAAYDWIGR